jgi:hypothetical protein
MNRTLSSAAWVLLGLCLLLFTGCSIRRVVYNDIITADQITFIRPGQTVMTEVVQQLGAPDEMNEAESGVIALYNWSDAKSAAVDFGALFRFFLPYSPSMTLNKTGIAPEQLMVVFDPQWTVRAYGFSRWPKEELIWFWPF